MKSHVSAMYSFSLVLLGICAIVTRCHGCDPNNDYSKILRLSLKFFRAQRSGRLPADNDISWRKDSFVDDRGEDKEDLSGGYFDAGKI